MDDTSPNLSSLLLFAAFPLLSNFLRSRSRHRRLASPGIDPPPWVLRFLETGVSTVQILSPSEADSWRAEVERLVSSRSGVRDVKFSAPYSGADVERAADVAKGLSSTFGSGGVMDVHLSEFQDRVRGDVRVWGRVRELYWHAFAGIGEGAVDWEKAYSKIERWVCGNEVWRCVGGLGRVRVFEITNPARLRGRNLSR